MNQSLIQNIIVYPFLASFFLALMVTPLCIRYLKKFGLFDDPKKRKHPGVIHSKPIPRGGGIPMYIPILIGGFLFLPITYLTISLFISSLIALIIGVFDDKYDISPYIRFTTNIICGLIVIQSGVSIPFITNPLGGILHLDTIRLSFLGQSFALSDGVALIWIVWVMNMLNWSKGVDGQMPGVVAISSIIIGLVTFRFSVSDTNTLTAAILSFLIAGSSLGFLMFNFYPAKIFPGYGATAIYLLLSVVSLLSSAKLATAILVMGVPMIDGVFTILRRILSGKSPFWHDKKHLHHILLDRGMSQRQIALFYWVISAIVGSLSLLLSSTGKFFAILMLVVTVGGGLLFLHLTLKKNS